MRDVPIGDCKVTVETLPSGQLTVAVTPVGTTVEVGVFGAGGAPVKLLSWTAGPKARTVPQLTAPLIYARLVPPTGAGSPATATFDAEQLADIAKPDPVAPPRRQHPPRRRRPTRPTRGIRTGRPPRSR